MKKIVLTFGLISGAVSAAMLLLTTAMLGRVGYDRAEILGYAGIVLAALLVFFGIRSYREKVGGGRIGFGRGLAVGLLITLISSACYVAAFQLVYFKLAPDFAERMTACMIDKVKAAGASPQKIEETRQQAQVFKRLWDNPLTNAAITFIEPFPIGLAASLLSAALLRRS